jgi:hypothetical protein
LIYMRVKVLPLTDKTDMLYFDSKNKEVYLWQ